MEIMDWVDCEFSTIDFNDERLSKRLKRSVTSAAGIEESEPHRHRQAGELKAVYRFVRNEKVTHDVILEQHHNASALRCQNHALVYLAQDTTEVNLTKPKLEIQGTGPLRNQTHRGFFYHPSLAISQQGVVLGVVDELIWTRKAPSTELTSEQRKQVRKRTCFEEKESARWLEIMQSNEQLARSIPGTHFVVLGDSEADINRLFCESPSHPSNMDMIIRVCHDHNLTAATTFDGVEFESVTKVDAALKQLSPIATRVIDVPGRPERSIPTNNKRNKARTARTTEVEIRVLKGLVSGSRIAGGGVLADVQMNIVQVLEKSPPEDEEPICWVLYTTLAVDCSENALAVVDGYRKRWAVELYFKTLKSGMSIEKMKYRTLKRYLVAFTMLSIVAWRVEYVKSAVRLDAQAPCGKYIAKTYWQPIVTFINRSKNVIDQMPTMQQFVVNLAQLGGYINKKSQGPPGSQTIWRGMQKAHTVVQAYDIFKQE